ncbi:MAG: protoporphyrinogen oxidase [Planctomycetota bacterium]|nr:protoporphyrinogen oxidase [Planctomycetota bacterium]
MKIRILGGGIAGLAAAFQLQEKHEVVVHEAGARVGGNIYTEQPDAFDGCYVEWGPNGFLDNEPATLDLIRRLGLESRLVRARSDRRFLWRAGKLRELPSSPRGFLTSDFLPLHARLRLMLAPLTKAGARGNETIHAFAARRMGKTVADTLVDAFVGGVYAGDPKRLELRTAAPRIATGGAMPTGPKGRLTSFDHGMSVLIDALAERVDVRTNVKTTLARGEDDRVMCAIPAPRAAPLCDDPLRSLLERIPTAPIAVIAMAFQESKHALDVPAAFGFLAPHGQGLRILGTLYDSDIFAGRAPEGLRLFRTMIGGRRDADAVGLTDDELTEIAARDLRQAWGRFPDPVAVQVIRHPLGIAQYEVGHGDLVQSIEAAAPAWLRLCGSSYRGIALNACIKEALDWAP